MRPDGRPPAGSNRKNPNQAAVSAHLLVLVKRVDDQLHHAVDFSLEGVFLGLLSEFLDLRSAQAVQLDRLLLSEEG